MKVKKIILSMVSAILMGIIFMSQTVLAEETGTWKFTEINAESFPSTINSSNPEYALDNLGDRVITQIGDSTGSRIINAYCAMANVGFEKRASWTNNTSKYEDTYTKKYNMSTDENSVRNSTIGKYMQGTENDEKYKQILTLADLFYLGNSDADYADYLAPLIDAGIIENDDQYAQIKAGSSDWYNRIKAEVITPEQVRAVQQTALWYFTNGFDYTNYDENTDFLTYRYVIGDYYSLKSNSGIRNKQTIRLYKYLINTAKTNAANSSYVQQNTVYIYLDNTTDDEQPIIEIEKGNKEFDLALRKHISKVTSNGTSTTYNAAGERNANVDTSKLNNPDTTSIYKHRKDPIVVKTGDIVEYTLTIYNEGDIAGRATKIVDKLPGTPSSVSLKTTGTVTSKKGNVYSISYELGTNEVTLETTGTNDIAAYNNGTMDSDSIKIECQVNAQPNSENDYIYTNIAWIAEYKNVGNYPDRDSNINGNNTPNIPTTLVTTNNGYTNNDNHDLTDKDHYFEGQEDDDDFEKIKVKAIKGSYNIVLVKEDKDGEQLNDTATFEIDGVTKTVTGRLTIVENKKITASNVGTVDTYIIKETVPPDEYCAFDGTIKIEVTKKLDGNQYVVDKVKYYVDDVEVTTNREDLKVYLNTDGNIYVEVKDYQFDLALRKFITKVATKASDYEEYTEYNQAKNRVPDITGQNVVTNKQTGATEDTTAQKQHTKTPLQVAKGDKVTYKIRIYNEGQVDGYAAEVTDYLPEGLSFIKKSESTINSKYNWEESTDANGKTVITSTYLKNKIIKAANDDFSKLDGEDYFEDLLVECIVNDKATVDNLKNIAAITKYEDKNGKEVEDRDSKKDSIDRNNYKDQNGEDGIGEEDDDDFEDLKLVELDLALRKYIARVADNANMTNATEYNRAPTVSASDIEKLYNNEIKTANYNHSKQPVKVNVGDYVEYTLRVYNEGSMDGYARKITDHLPEYLEYVDCDLNKAYNWDVSKDGRTVTTDYLNTTKLNAVSKTTIDTAGNVSTKYVLDSTEKLVSETEDKELKIICKVKDTVPAETNQTNIAEITKYGDKGNKELDVDRDSQTIGDGLVKLPTDKELPDYKKSDIDSGKTYIPGQQDDDDFEKVYVPKFDLSLRKFITSVNEKAPENTREPKVDVSELKDGTSTTAKYEHPKDPVDVVNGDIVEYTLRIFNEGNASGYASVITDDIPEGTEFLPDNETNKQYRWVMYTELPEGVEVKDESKVVELNINADSKVKKYVETTDASKAVIIRTDYLSMEQGQERMKEDTSLKTNPNLIKAFDGEDLDYKDVKIAFKVTEPNGSERVLINYAQISDDQDENGNKVKDIDSETDKWNEGEDDQDIEKLRLPIFDLALRKWVTQAIVIENGNETVTETGHQPFDDEDKDIVKVELNRKKLSDVTVKFRYSIRVYNEGEIEGYAKEVTDYIPEGLKFVAEDNPDWKDEGNNVISTRKLENTLLKPGEYADVEVLLTWINNKDNMGLKRNTAEISEDYNEKGVPDKDSTPDNRKPGEDDIDDAPVLLSISTGKEITYIALGASVLLVLAGGIFLIKKYVL